MELLGDVGHVDLVLVHLEIVLVSVQDRCKVCAKRTTGLDIFWTHPIDLVLVHLETVLVSVEDIGMVCAKHTIGSEIILDTPDRTPR
jgi:hypothetical protein